MSAGNQHLAYLIVIAFAGTGTHNISQPLNVNFSTGLVLYNVFRYLLRTNTPSVGCGIVFYAPAHWIRIGIMQANSQILPL